MKIAHVVVGVQIYCNAPAKQLVQVSGRELIGFAFQYLSSFLRKQRKRKKEWLVEVLVPLIGDIGGVIVST